MVRIRHMLGTFLAIAGVVLPLHFVGGVPPAGAIAANGASPSIMLLPATVGRGDYVTVIAEHLTPPIDRYCVYLNSPLGPRPLAHFVPPGYGEQGSPLIPAPDGTTGVGAYQTWYGLAGTYRVSVASCAAGLQPTTIQAVASARLTIRGNSATPPFGLRVIGDTPLGQPFAVDLPHRSAATCVFVAPEDVFAAVGILPGVRVPAGATSASLTVPATDPWGVHQLLWSEAAADGSCSVSQIRAGSLLGAASWAPGQWKLRMESDGIPSAGSGLAIDLDRSFDVGAAPTPVCLAIWNAGRYAGIERTYSAKAVGPAADAIPPHDAREAPRLLLGAVASARPLARARRSPARVLYLPRPRPGQRDGGGGRSVGKDVYRDGHLCEERLLDRAEFGR